MKPIFIHLIVICVSKLCLVTSEESKIVGGETSPHHYPYQVSLQIKLPFYVAFLPLYKNGWTHNCGGSIITEKHVLTAAHCLSGYTAESLSILAGTEKLNEGGSRIFVDKFIIHPNYVELNTSDIGIITTKESFVYGEKIRPIKYSNQFIDGKQICTLTGWGFTTMIRFGRPPNELQRAGLQTITNEECKKQGMDVGKTEICTFSRFGQGACAGDSGGPLATDDIVIGVVSYGTRVCSVGQPDVYTRVSEFSEWITENLI